MSHNIKLIRCITSEKKQSTESVCCILSLFILIGSRFNDKHTQSNRKMNYSLQTHAHTQINQYLYIRHCVHANKQLHTLTLKKQQPWPLSRGTQADKRFPRGTGLTHSGLQRDCGYPQSPATDAKTRTCPISTPLPFLRCRSLAGVRTIAQPLF